MPLHEVVPTPLFGEGAFRWRLSTRVLTADQWLQVDDEVDAYLAAKRQILRDERADALVTRPGSEVASAELADLVAAELERLGRPLPADRHTMHPIEWAARGVQEDLCLLERRHDAWVFTAAAVCFPTRWSPAEKVGLELAAVHGPVPHYDTIAANVERFFDRLRPGALAWRPNWSIVGDDRLRLPADDRQAPTTMPADPENDLWLRVERQTIRRLDQNPSAIVFGVRIHRWRLGEVLHDVDEALASALQSMPAVVAEYKNLESWRSTLAAHLIEG